MLEVVEVAVVVVVVVVGGWVVVVLVVVEIVEVVVVTPRSSLDKRRASSGSVVKVPWHALCRIPLATAPLENTHIPTVAGSIVSTVVVLASGPSVGCGPAAVDPALPAVVT